METTTPNQITNSGNSCNSNSNNNSHNIMPTAVATSKDEVDFVVVAHNNNNNIHDYDISQKANSNNNNNNNFTEIVPKTLNSTATISNTEYHNNTTNQQVPNKDTTKSKRKLFSSSATNSTSSDKDDTAKKHSNKERLSLFSFGKRNSHKAMNNSSINSNNSSNKEPSSDCAEKSQPKPTTLQCDLPSVPIGTPPRQHKYVKSSSIARLLGNTYNAKKFEKQEQKANDGKFHTYGGRRRLSGPYLERFKRYSKEDGDAASTAPNTDELTLPQPQNEEDLQMGHRNELGDALEHFQDNVTTVPLSEERGVKAMRSISRGLGKLWWKRTHSVDISTPDPEFKVSYLGNVLTGWAKGEGCVEKQLNTLWRNYTQNNKPDVIMRIKVCASGLKATTRQHGLTEYWANRITHCCAPKNYPRVFCWIYRHEGRKLKHELRCHAVLCSKEKVVQEICSTLKENLERALREFKREKILKQNARLSLANAAYDNPSLPRRKILLSVGGNNYRPPLERSKSAPKLMAIEEAIGEEDGDEVEETNEPEMKPCCQKDSLYPAMTLGRRRCRRGHSIRRTGKTRPTHSLSLDETHYKGPTECCHNHSQDTKETVAETANKQNVEQTAKNTEQSNEQQRNSYGSDDSDDFDKLLKYNNYDTNASLATELLPYFDMQLHKNTSSSLGNLSELKDEEEPLSMLPTINSDPSANPEGDLLSAHDDTDEGCVGLRRNGVCSDGEEDYLDSDDLYFRQTSILNMLHRNSMRKMANFSLSSDESSIETNVPASLQYRHQMQSSISSNASSTTTTSSSAQDGHAAGQHKLLNADSDEGSISSGCETASTVTANQDDISLQYRNAKQLQQPTLLADSTQLSEHLLLDNDESPITADEIYQRLESRLQRRQNSDATTFSSSSSITLKMSGGAGSSPTESMNGGGGELVGNNARVMRRQRRQSANQQQQQQQRDDTDSECSDESGYVEFQERDKSARESSASEGGNSTVGRHVQQRQQQQQTKPQLPPKPLPRRLLNVGGNGVGCGTSTAV